MKFYKNGKEILVDASQKELMLGAGFATCVEDSYEKDKAPDETPDETPEPTTTPAPTTTAAPKKKRKVIKKK